MACCVGRQSPSPLKDTEYMPNLALNRLSGMVLGAALIVLGATGSAFALDPNANVSKERGPFDLFKLGFKAYREGNKQEAVEAYRYAAEKGHTGSRWALATMYADGDGVVKNDFEAFKIYSEIATQGVEPGSNDTGFFVNALMALADYYSRGIPESPVSPDLSQARQLYFQAASAFGNAEAQFRLAKMLLSGDGGEVNIRQAKKWLNRARREGHIGAMGVFGNVLFEEGQTVRELYLLDGDSEDAGWQERGLCAQTDPEAFFPEKGGSTREAKKVCLTCDVRQDCLEYALENDERFGIWGGLSERERRKLKKRAV